MGLGSELADEPEPEPELEGEPMLPPSPPENVAEPVQALSPSCMSWLAWPRYATSSPGLGKRMLTLSGVVQPLTLATNMPG